MTQRRTSLRANGGEIFRPLLLLLFILLFIFSLSNCFAQSGSQSFNHTASTQTWVVPNGVCSVFIKAWGAGAGGGGCDGNTSLVPGTGGAGAYCTYTASVTPGDVLTVYVGGSGSGGVFCSVSSGGGIGGWGYGSGGNGGNAGASGCSGGGGGGGGGSAVIINGSATPVVVAAGGGGGGGAGRNGPSGSGEGGAGGASGNPGESGTTGGIVGLSSTIDGAVGASKSGDGPGAGGGGGGYFGGGLGGTVFSGFDSNAAGGGGGGNYALAGGTVLSGNLTVPGNAADPDLCAGCAIGGAATTGNGGPGGDGFVKVFWNQSAVITTGVSAQTNVSCFGGNNGNASVSASGGTPPYTYSWSPSGGSSSSASGLSAGIYSVIISDGSPCGVSSQTISITEPAAFTATVSSQTNILCNGGNTGAAAISASGGMSVYTYAWSPSGGTNASATGLTAGNYTVSVVDANGCTASPQIFSITQPPALSASVAAVNPNCNTTNGSATATGSGGTGSYSYFWGTTPMQTTQSITGLSAGTYSMAIMDSSGCISPTQTFVVTQPAALTVSVSSVNPLCGTGTGTATATGSGGTAPYTYVWSVSPAQSSQTVTGLITGTYSVSVIDANGCTSSVQILSIAQPVSVSALAAGVNPNCATGTGTALGGGSGGTSPYTYLWSTNPVQNTQTASGLAAGTYSLTVVDANGCSSPSQTVVITVPPAITVSVSATQTSCSANTGTASGNASGGTGGFNYLWNPAGQTSQSITGLSAGTYSLIVADASGCTMVQVANVTQISSPMANVSASPQQITLGQNSQLTAGGGGTYQWSPVSGLSCSSCQNPIAKPSSTTQYCVLVTDANGCSDSACVTVTVDIPCGTLFLPNAFSPNGDGENDSLQIRIGTIECITAFKISIFNRWGELVFRSDDPAFRWDGSYSNRMLQISIERGSAVFGYLLHAEMADGTTVRQSGNVSLIR